MADYFSIPDTAIDPDAPLTSQLGYAWRDNCIAIAEGAAGAPRVRLPAFDRLVAGSTVKFSRAFPYTAAGVVFGNLPFIQFGTVTVGRTISAGATLIITRIRAGASTVITPGAYPGNISVQPGDLWQLAQSGGGAGTCTLTCSTNGVDIFPIGNDWSGYTTVNAAP